MAETVHGTKANQFGPAHQHDKPSLLCQDGQCETCAARIFVLHLVFFRDEFKGKVRQQHGEKQVCADAKCTLCFQPDQWSLVCCPGEKCAKQTGRVRTGMVRNLLCSVWRFSSWGARGCLCDVAGRGDLSSAQGTQVCHSLW